MERRGIRLNARARTSGWCRNRLRTAGRAAALVTLCILSFAGSVHADRGNPGGQPSPLAVCDQKYALCATAQCFYLNEVAYCKCNLKEGKSISLSFAFDNNTQNVCSMLDDGLRNGYTVSTFSLPDEVTKRYAREYKKGSGKPAPLALYTCPRRTTTGPYAQCDGGVCFDSTSGTTFPGVGDVGRNQIVCSCPLTTPRRVGPDPGYQITGPWQRANGKACGPNDSKADCCSTEVLEQFCTPSYGSTPPTGATIPVGAPTGLPVVLSALLGDLRPINTCFDR